MPHNDDHTRYPTQQQVTGDGLYLVAMLEGAKGVLVLLTGFGILSLIHRDLHQAALQLLQYFHYNPNSRYPRIFVDLASHVTNLQLWVFAAIAGVYAVIRLIEAWGLWNRQPWAEWFGLVSGGIYIPVEVYELVRGISWFKVAVLLINVAVVIYLFRLVVQTGQENTTT